MDGANDRQPLDSSPPSAFVTRWVNRLSPAVALPRRALDVAMGTGRHTCVLAQAGFATFGVDISLDAVQSVRRRIDYGRDVHVWCADLTRPALPVRHFDLIVVTRYLQRDLFTVLAEALVPGGHLLYETFTEAQRAHGWGPRSSDHLLKPGELLELTAMLDPIDYEEVEAPEAVARLVARRSTSLP